MSLFFIFIFTKIKERSSSISKRMYNKMKKEQFKSVEIGQSREKAMNIGYVNNFNDISIYNHVQDIKLKAVEVEYQHNFNPRYIHDKNKIYRGNEVEQILNKSNNNLKRLSQIINNCNKDFKTNHQYIVFHQSLIKNINIWIDELYLSSKNAKYGINNDDISLLHSIFNISSKEWLVIDGNSYFSSIHQSYIAEKELTIIPKEIALWSRYYKSRKSLGKAYTDDLLSINKNEYDIQMIQLISLVMEKNMSSWSQSDKIEFMKVLYRILFSVAYKNKSKWINANDMFLYIQAIRYLTLPFDKTTIFKQTQRMNYLLLTAMFEQKDNKVCLEKTTYNIKMYRNLIEGIITNYLGKGEIDFVLESLQEVYNAMIRYQFESLNILKDIDGQSARDRLTKIDSLCANSVMKSTFTFRDLILNEKIDIKSMRLYLTSMTNNMIEVYQEYLSSNVKKILHNNSQIANNISNIYQLGNFSDKLSERDFFLLIMDAIKCA